MIKILTMMISTSKISLLVAKNFNDHILTCTVGTPCYCYYYNTFIFYEGTLNSVGFLKQCIFYVIYCSVYSDGKCIVKSFLYIY